MTDLVDRAGRVTVRTATVADIAAMHDIRLAVRENVLANFDHVRAAHYRALIERGGHGWVSELDGSIVGFAIADALHRNLWALFVAPGCERRGIGRNLLDVAVRWLFVQGDEPVWLTTEPRTRAARVYAAAGWRCVGDAGGGEIRFELTRHAWAARGE